MKVCCSGGGPSIGPGIGRCSGVEGAEQTEGTGVAVEVGGGADGTDFTAAEEVAQGHFADGLEEGVGVVVGLAEEALAAAGTGEEQGAGGGGVDRLCW